MTDKELLQSRLQELEKGRENLVARLNAQMGAIEECKHWLSQIEDGAGDEPAPTSTARKQNGNNDPKPSKSRT